MPLSRRRHRNFFWHNKIIFWLWSSLNETRTTATEEGAGAGAGAGVETRTKQASEVARVMAMTAAKVAEVNAESSGQRIRLEARRRDARVQAGYG